MTGGEIDFGRTAADYARHRKGWPEEVFERLRDRHGLGGAGQLLLDVGSGTGQAARGLARAGARVVALDPSLELLAAGRGLEQGGGSALPRVRGRAESLPLAAGALDGVVVVQAFHWFERPRFLAEVRRVLAPGGRLCVGQFDWLPRRGSVPEATEALILEHNPRWHLGGLDGLPTHFVRELEEAGFGFLETFAFDVDVLYTHADWRGRIRASAGVAAGALSREEVRRFDEALAALLRERFPEDPLRVPHRVFCLLGRPGANEA